MGTGLKGPDERSEQGVVGVPSPIVGGGQGEVSQKFDARILVVHDIRVFVSQLNGLVNRSEGIDQLAFLSLEKLQEVRGDIQRQVALLATAIEEAKK